MLPRCVRAVSAMSDPRDAVLAQGIHAMFSRWTALRLAVDNNWGGGDPGVKYNKLVSAVIGLFGGGKAVYPDDVEIVLESAMVEDFAVEAEDGSCMEVAERIVELYRRTALGDFSMSAELVGAARALPSSVAQSVSAGGGSDDDDDDDGNGVDDVGGGMDIENAELQARPSVMVDDDGWMTVPAGRGRSQYLPPAP